MKLTDCKKASIYDLNNLYLLDASVSDFEEDTVTLTFNELASEVLNSEVYVTFYDNSLGLITCYCQLSEYKEFLAAPAMWGSRVLCQIEEQISVLQRRNDIKVPVNMQTVIRFSDNKDVITDVTANVKNISAGGVFFTCHYAFLTGQIFEFTFQQKDTGLMLTGEILRVQQITEETTSSRKISSKNKKTDKEPLFGYGCRFINMSPYKESIIRNFVYRQDLSRRRGKELYI